MSTPIDESWPRPGAPVTHDTQPILPSGAPIDPPPSGLQPESLVGADAVAWQSRYEEQHKRSRIFMAATAAAVAALLGSVFFAVAQGGAVDSASFTPAGVGPGQVQGPGGDGPVGGPPGFDHHDDDRFEEFDDD